MLWNCVFLVLCASTLWTCYFRCVLWNCVFLVLCASTLRTCYFSCVLWNCVFLVLCASTLRTCYFRCVLWNCVFLVLCASTLRTDSSAVPSLPQETSSMSYTQCSFSKVWEQECKLERAVVLLFHICVFNKLTILVLSR